jgi:chromosome segregation ATPase
MSGAGKHVEFGDPGNSFFAATFRRALTRFEIGDLPYTEVQFELKRLLAGVSRRELRELLRRSESIEPLPAYAYREVRRFLDETIEQDVALQTDPAGVREQEEELDPAALTAELQKSREALESERTRVREAEEALSERIVAEEAVRSRLGITLRESERHQAELSAARNSIASRDKVTAQIRQTLDERDAQLAAIRREHAELAAALDSRSASSEQLDADLQVLRGQAADAAAELAASRDAADKERRKRQEIELALTESNSLNSAAARESLASKDKALAEMRQTLDERDAQLVALQRELQAALQASEEKLEAAQRHVVGANMDLDGLRTQVANLQASLRDNNALIEKLGASVRSEAERATQWQAAALQRESEATMTSARVEAMPQVEVLPRAHAAQASAALAEFLSAVRGWRWNIRMAPRPIWIGAAIVLLATVIWFAANRPSPMLSSPAASNEAMIPQATPALATESVEPESVSTENVSAIEAPPHRAATPAAGKPVTAGVKLNTDFRRCRAGGIDACYDAIRYRPSDPSLLSALGDALLRANRPADALRAYQRVAILAPNMPGVVAKISALEAKLSAK